MEKRGILSVPDFLQIAAQRVLPSRKGRKAGFYKLAPVKTAVERTRRLIQTVLLRCHRQNLRLIAGLTVDFLGKIVPADIAAFIGCMVVSVFLGLIRAKSYV